MSDEQEKNMVCYIIARSDLRSMNEGKLAAHGQHAGVQMVAKYYDHPDVKEYIRLGLEHGADFFNTTLCVEADKATLELVVEMSKRLGYLADTVVDPSYPYFADKETVVALGSPYVKEYRDGKVLMLRPELTFGWVLGDKNDPVFDGLMAKFPLRDYNKLIYTLK